MGLTVLLFVPDKLVQKVNCCFFVHEAKDH